MTRIDPGALAVAGIVVLGVAYLREVLTALRWMAGAF